jgi:hypothetical protein
LVTGRVPGIEGLNTEIKHKASGDAKNREILYAAARHKQLLKPYDSLTL